MTERHSVSPEKGAGGLQERGEMRLATVMMVDMLGSTEMSERLGPEDSFRISQRVLQIVRSIVATHGGRTMDEVGDGLFAIFGAPVSIDRASLAACRAALEICATMRSEADDFRARHDVEPQVRIGLAAGEVLMTERETDATLKAAGVAVNLAARLQSLAEPNGVVYSESVAVEVEGFVHCQALGPHSVKGFGAQIEVFRLDGLPEGAGDPGPESLWRTGRFVGRAAELARLDRWLTGGGDRRVGLIVGEAGIGKSRLLGEFSGRLDGRRLIVGSCHPAATARPLAPLIEILRGFAGWSPAASADAVHEALGPILPEAPEARDALVRLVIDHAPTDDLGAVAFDQTRLRGALETALTALGDRRDCLVAVEDLHWIDPLSGEVLLAVVRAAPPGFRMMGTTRPVSFLGRLPEDRTETVAIGPMEASDIAAIAETLMGEAAERPLVDRVAKSSEGNPFFAIEILHHVAARGHEVQAGRIGSIQNIALARFDPLEPATKALLRMASVQGRSFRLDVLRAAEGPGAGVSSLPAVVPGIVEPDPSDPDGSARFRHILFRDAIYSTIPSSASRAMHLRTAQALESCAGREKARYADVLADHYELAEQPAQAVAYLREAARNAYRLYALESCKSLTERAFRLIEAHPDSFGTEVISDAVAIRLRCLDVMDQFRAVIKVSEQWLPRLRTDDGTVTEALLLAITAKAQCHLAQFDTSLALAREAQQIATRLGHERALAYAKVVTMRALSDSDKGRIEDIERLFDETRVATEDLHDPTLYANRMFHLMSAYRGEGLLRRAMDVNEEIQAFAERHDHPHLLLVSGWNRTYHHILTNDLHAAVSSARWGLEQSVRNSAVWEVFRVMEATALLLFGRDVVIEEIERIEKSCAKRGEFATRNSAHRLVAFALIGTGRLWRGWRQIRSGDTLIEVTGHREARRYGALYKAELLLTLAGLIPFDGPKPKLGPADIVTAIYLRLTGRRSAKALLQRLLADVGREDGIIVARAHAGLGLIAASEGKTETAQEKFAVAQHHFEAEGLGSELDRLAVMRKAAGLNAAGSTGTEGSSAQVIAK